MEKLSALEHLRNRPGMYIGDTTVRGLTLLVGELISNSVDEFLHGSSSFVSVQFDGHKMTVSDDGGGLPFDSPSIHDNDCRVTDFLTRHHDKPSADDHAPHVHVHSIGGAGLFVVAALSERLTIESVHDGNLWRQVYSRGKRIENDTVRHVSPEDDLQKGTRVGIVGDPEIFGDVKAEPKSMRDMLINVAHLFPGLRVHLQEETFHTTEGLADLALSISQSDTSKHFTFSAEVESMKITAVARGNAEEGEETIWKSWSNGMLCWEGGTHRDAFAEALNSINWKPAVALIHAVMLEPKFAGPTATRLNVDEKKPALVAALKANLASHIACDENN